MGRRGVVGLVFLTVCLAVTGPVHGQERADGAAPPRQPAALADILEQIRWDPVRQGALLIVDPKNTRRAMRKKYFGYGGYSLEPIAEFPPPVPGGYRFNNIADYFGRRLVSLGTINVFAPTTMAVLNYRDLPKPSPYAGMSRTEKLQLLAGSLKPAQWRRLAGPEGLGMGDLDGRQREIFAATFAEDMRVTRSVSGGNGEAQSSDVITLTPEQKAGIRLRVRRHLSWMYELGENGFAGLGESDPAAGDGRVQMFLGIGDGTASPPKMFGAVIRDEVPARLKPGQLPFDWAALDRAIPLAGADTVGDLVKRVAEQTRAEIYCDVRYAGLPVYVRGDAARAGDLLKALCWAVTGTFRRVGPAFVLTDDIVGLGTRRSRIAEWAQANATLAREAQEDVKKTIKAAHPEGYVSWDPNDPLAADDKLRTRIAAYHERLKKPMTAEEQRNPNLRQLTVPVSELPPAIQAIVKGQVDRYRRGEIRFGENQEMRTDRVVLQMDARLVYLIPDVGEVSSNEDSGLSEFVSDQNLIYNSPPSPASAPKIPESVTLKADGKPHALILGVASAAEVGQAASAAKQAGFTELWLELDPKDTSAIDATITQAKKGGLLVRALIPVLRQNPGAPDLPADVNIRGETFTEFAGRRSQAPIASGMARYGGDLRREQVEELLRQKRIGDWVRCDLPEGRMTQAANIARVAAIPGISGVVLVDLSAPGYAGENDTAYFTPRAMGADSQFGYSGEMRLAHLRQTGIDPVDLGAAGSIFASTYVPYRQNWYGDSALPFFNDYGPEGGSVVRYNDGVPRTETAARDGWSRWNRFRRDVARQFRGDLLREVRARIKNGIVFAAPPAPNSFDGMPPWYGSVDKELAVAKGGGPASESEAATPPEPGKPIDLAASAKAQSDTAYAAWTYFPVSDAKDRRTDFLMQAGWSVAGLQRGAWDGMVIDLSRISTGTAIALLGAFAPPTAQGMETETPAASH